MSTYYEKNKEKVLEYQKQYRQDNPLRMVWNDIKKRCCNPKTINYKDYGGRGIKVCDEWLDNLESFKEWCLDNGYQRGLEIDRVNNNGNYCPNNCQFIAQAENLAIGKKRKRADNTSGYTGVSFHKASGKYKAVICHSKKQIHLGLFTTPELALQARINKEIELLGEQKANLEATNG